MFSTHVPSVRNVARIAAGSIIFVHLLQAAIDSPAALVVDAPAHAPAASSVRFNRAEQRGTTVLWSDDMEDGAPGWAHRDHGWGIRPHFHIDSYMAFEGNGSWWCGSFEFDTDGGYGNSWDDRLELPPVDATDAAYPILTFAHYFHSEPTRDATVLQAMRAGELDDLNTGFSGLIPGGTWIDLGTYGYVVDGFDNPLDIRFRFMSDGAHSDEDGGFDSTGGAYMVDNIKVFDFYGGEIYFLDDAESGGLCNPSVPALTGDFWHVTERSCAASSDPHCWWCG
ncbi:hypothetical protein K8S17_03400, partial [bacterium]|nr:hypothetical protein [bacterium]